MHCPSAPRQCFRAAGKTGTVCTERRKVNNRIRRTDNPGRTESFRDFYVGQCDLSGYRPERKRETGREEGKEIPEMQRQKRGTERTERFTTTGQKKGRAACSSSLDGHGYPIWFFRLSVNVYSRFTWFSKDCFPRPEHWKHCFCVHPAGPVTWTFISSGSLSRFLYLHGSKRESSSSRFCLETECAAGIGRLF